MKRSYGMPYVGSKNRYVKDICQILPAGKRLVELFGGGGAITDYATEFCLDKWELFYYNEYNEDVVKHFKRAIEGDVHPRWVDRDEFVKFDLDMFEKFCFGFGNKIGCATYFAEPKRAELTKKVFLGEMTLEDAKKEALKIGIVRVPSNMHCEPRERWNRLLGMKKTPDILDRITVTSLDYREYQYQDGDVVYCDIPYELTKHGNKEMYGEEFDHQAFWEWAESRPFDVYVSSHLHGEPVYIKKTNTRMSGNSNALKRIEAVLKV